MYKLLAFVCLLNGSLAAAEGNLNQAFIAFGDRTHNTWEYAFVRCREDLYMQQAQWPGYQARKFYRLRVNGKISSLLDDLKATKADVTPPFPPESAKLWRVVVSGINNHPAEFFSEKSKANHLLKELTKEMMSGGKSQDDIPNCIKDDEFLAKSFGISLKRVSP